MMYPDVGDMAPDFTLASTCGQLQLSEHLTHGMVLLVEETRLARSKPHRSRRCGVASRRAHRIIP